MPSGISFPIAPPFEFDPAFACRCQPGDQLEQRRLAAAGRPDDGEELALADEEIDRPERVHRLPSRAGGKALADAFQRNMGRGHPARAARYSTDFFRSSGRNSVVIILVTSISPVSAPTLFCTSMIRFMPDR